MITLAPPKTGPFSMQEDDHRKRRKLAAKSQAKSAAIPRKASNTSKTLTLDLTTPSFCLDARCKAKCTGWVSGYGKCHLGAIAYTAKTQETIEHLFKSFNEQFCEFQGAAAWRTRARKLRDLHNKYTELNDPQLWPPLSYGPHHPSLYDVVDVQERNKWVRYKAIKLPISEDLFKQAVTTLEHTVGSMNIMEPSKKTDWDSDSSSRSNSTSDRQKRKLKKYLTDPQWKNNVVVRPITDPRHPAYRASGATQFRVVALRRIPAGAVVGPAVYAGVFRPAAETDQLELDSEGMLAERWAYSFSVPLFTVPEHNENVRMKFNEISVSLIDRGRSPHITEADTEVDTESGDDLDLDPPTPQTSRQMDGINPAWRRSTQMVLPPEVLNWDVEAAQLRNELAMVNDPKGLGQALGLPASEEIEGNCATRMFKLFNVPCVYFVATCDLAAGDEILVEYGEAYWQRLQAMRWCKTENIAIKLLQQETDRNLQKLQSDMRREQTQQQKLRDEVKRLRQQRVDNKGLSLEAKSMLLRKENELLEKDKELFSLESTLNDLHVQKAGLEEKHDELRSKIVAAERVVTQKENLVRYIESENLKKMMKETAGMSTTTATVRYCIYSEVAELLGFGGRHIVGNNFHKHYSICKFQREPMIQERIYVCPRCSLHILAGTESVANHDANVCDQYLKLHKETGDEEDEAEGRNLLRTIGSLVVESRMSQGKEEENKPLNQGTKLMRTFLALITHNDRLNYVLRYLIFGVFQGLVKAAGPAKGSSIKKEEAIPDADDEDKQTRNLLRHLLVKEFGVDYDLILNSNDSLNPKYFSNNYELMRIVCGEHFGTWLRANCPQQLRWISDVSRRVLQFYDSMASGATLPISTVVELAEITDALNRKLDIVEYTDDLVVRDVEDAAALIPRVVVDHQTLANYVREYHAQFRWPTHPLPGIVADPISARNKLYSQIFTHYQSVKTTKSPATESEPDSAATTSSVKADGEADAKTVSESLTHPAEEGVPDVEMKHSDADSSLGLDEAVGADIIEVGSDDDDASVTPKNANSLYKPPKTVSTKFYLGEMETEYAMCSERQLLASAQKSDEGLRVVRDSPNNVEAWAPRVEKIRTRGAGGRVGLVLGSPVAAIHIPDGVTLSARGWSVELNLRVFVNDKLMEPSGAFGRVFGQVIPLLCTAEYPLMSLMVRWDKKRPVSANWMVTGPDRVSVLVGSEFSLDPRVRKFPFLEEHPRVKLSYALGSPGWRLERGPESHELTGLQPLDEDIKLTGIGLTDVKKLQSLQQRLTLVMTPLKQSKFLFLDCTVTSCEP